MESEVHALRAVVVPGDDAAPAGIGGRGTAIDPAGEGEGLEILQGIDGGGGGDIRGEIAFAGTEIEGIGRAVDGRMGGKGGFGPGEGSGSAGGSRIGEGSAGAGSELELEYLFTGIWISYQRD